MLAQDPADLPVWHVDAGEVQLCRKPAILRTVLGSCVGVTFWSARLAVGALCHAALPRRPSEWPSDEAFPWGHRYVDVCIRYLIRQFDALGLKRGEVEVKLFGGADVLAIPRSARTAHTVGKQNCAAAWETLDQHGVVPAAWDLGGSRGRVISFHSGTGEVLVRRLPAVRDPHSRFADSVRGIGEEA